MKWKWDMRPPEFLELPSAQRRRVWDHCCWIALRRPRVLVPMLVIGAGGGIAAGMIQGMLAKPSSAAAHAAGTAVSIALTVLTGLPFGWYVTRVMRDELRDCATRSCLNCWYDLTGNTSGVCPECGAPRVNNRPPDLPSDPEPDPGARAG